MRDASLPVGIWGILPWWRITQNPMCFARTAAHKLVENKNIPSRWGMNVAQLRPQPPLPPTNCYQPENVLLVKRFSCCFHLVRGHL
jgi:hypothetical protein